jgi:hypothetical protein
MVSFQRKLESRGEGEFWILGSSLQAEAFRLKPDNDIIKQFL